MASNSNITGVHFALIVFAMLSLMLGVVAWVQTGEAKDNAASAKTAEENRKALDTKWNDAQDKLSELQKKIGVPGNVMLDAPTDENNALKQIDEIMNQLLGADGARSGKLAEVAKTVYTKYVESDESLKDIVALHNSEKAERGKQKKDYLAKIDALDKKLETEVAAHLSTIVKIKETLDPLKTKIKELDEEKQALASRIDTLVTAHQRESLKLTQQIATLRTTVLQKTRLLAETNQHSFEIPDGEILAVNYQLGLVWINLGKADILPKRGTFSVYSRSNNGIGRGEKFDPDNPNAKSRWKSGPEDIKGAIEITRITGPHEAEARILLDERDLYKPLAVGDLIYSPAYTPGQTNSFALAGMFDINNDGNSDTAALKAEILRNGGRVSIFLDENVTTEFAKNRPSVSIQDKFLVLGAKPALPKPPANDEEEEYRKKLEAHKRMLEEYGKMIQEAQDNGVRIVRMNDFLAFMGIKPVQRLFRPGDNIRVLKSGSKSSGIGGISNRRGTSVVSRLYYGKRNQLKPNRSTGQVSGKYKSGGK